MRTKPIWFLLLTLPLFILSVMGLHAASHEEVYFETKDRFIRLFGKATDPIDERTALAELEKQLRTIVGPVRIDGFQQPGRINLLTLLKKPGFGQVDGLRFDSIEPERGSLFVTTDVFLKHYLEESPELPNTFNELSKTGDFYRRVFLSDAGVTYYAELPLKDIDGNAFAHAFLGASSQDIGPIIPKEIFVFFSTGKRILVVSAPATTRITDIPQCRKEWEDFNRKSADALEVYRSSQLKDKKAIDDAFRYEAEGFEAYCRCFGREFKSRPFDAVRNQAQTIVDRLRLDISK